MSEIKFTEEELSKLKKIQQSYFEVQNGFGQISISRITLSKQLDDLDAYEDDLMKKFQSHRDEEKTFVDEITKKYGDGQLNVKDGTFIPNK